MTVDRPPSFKKTAPVTSLAVIVSHPIQHFVPVYKYLAQHADIRIKVFFIGENGAYEYFDSQFNQTVKWDVPLTEGYDHEFLSPGRILKDYGFLSVDDASIVERLLAFKPDMIWLNGYGQRVNWRALSLRSKGIKFLYSSDSNLEDSRSAWRRWLKRLVVTHFLKKCDYFLSYGPKNSSYLDHYGVSVEQISRVTYPVDMQRLLSQKDKLSDRTVENLRAQLGIPPEHKIVLFAGKLIPHKRPSDVIDAIAGLRDYPISTVIVGNGELLEALKIQVKQLDLTSRIVFTGFVNQSELAQYFSLADVFVFPSEKEPFGAVASEALPFGLPIVAANNIGSVGSSIIKGENALLYQCGDIDELSGQIQRLITEPELLAKFSAASLEMTDSHDVSVMGDAIRKRLASIDSSK